MAFGVIKVFFLIANRLLSNFRDTQAINLRVEVQIQQLSRPQAAGAAPLLVLSSNRTTTHLEAPAPLTRPDLPKTLFRQPEIEMSL